ncbi:transposase [Streptomyces laculatispora]|uniref:Transposase n=1 Tax=Streptomyces laculatispora TaxID=887464 RepID=A0ABY9IF39_9ACTN|nr:transposase [Streptomyces laculatispora]WLQ45572.1 transposase [Streptomyces laculatispora]
MNLSDRQAAEAVRCRIDFKYALGLELEDPGFHHSVLSDFPTGSPKATAPTGCWASRSPESGRPAYSRGVASSAPTPPTSCPPRGS